MTAQSVIVLLVIYLFIVACQIERVSLLYGSIQGYQR
jgi:hypothetical protein